jgi:hypothetical protein
MSPFRPFSRRAALGFGLGLIALARGSLAAAGAAGTLYKTPGCGCCDGHAAHLREHGIVVASVETPDLAQIKRQHGVPDDLAGCHTILLDGFVVEGHVPAPVILRLLRERPRIRGIALAGMPEGSPGMPGPKTGPWTIYAFGNGKPTVYAIE